MTFNQKILNYEFRQTSCHLKCLVASDPMYQSVRSLSPTESEKQAKRLFPEQRDSGPALPLGHRGLLL